MTIISTCSTTKSPRSPLPDSNLRAYGIAMIACAAIAAADYALLSIRARTPGLFIIDYLFYALFIGQVAFLATATGKQLRHVRGRWLFFVWCLVLVNLMLAAMGPGWNGVFKYAFQSAQFALLCVWCFLGRAPWSLRVATGMVLGPILLSWSGGGDGWSVIFLFQSAVALATSAMGWFLGYRIRRTDQDTDIEICENRQSVQFSLRDIMIWMLALGPAMLILKSLTWFHMLQLQWSEFGATTHVACAFTVSTIATLYATLGKLRSRGSVPILLFRCGTVFFLPLFVGLCLWLGFAMRARQLGTWVGFGEGFTEILMWTGNAWPMWTVLASLFLSALLLCFRADGQRLTRILR